MQEVYKNGLPFTSPLDISLRKLDERVKNHKASMVIIDGGLGEGKTTLLIHLLDYINKINDLPIIDLEGSQFATGGTDFLQKLRLCYENKFPCIGYDEAGDFTRRGSLTGFNAMLNRTFETFRAFKCLVILALPCFSVLDNMLIDKNIPRLLLTCKNRTQHSGTYAALSLYRLQLLKYRMAKYHIKNAARNTVIPNYYGHFLNLDTERSKLLDKISSKNKIEILRKAEVKIEGLLTKNELSTKLNRTPIWVHCTLAKLKVKAVKVIKKRNYYPPEAIDILNNYMDKIYAGKNKAGDYI